jgi:hypothetical protein
MTGHDCKGVVSSRLSRRVRRRFKSDSAKACVRGVAGDGERWVRFDNFEVTR